MRCRVHSLQPLLVDQEIDDAAAGKKTPEGDGVAHCELSFVLEPSFTFGGEVSNNGSVGDGYGEEGEIGPCLGRELGRIDDCSEAWRSGS